MSRLKKALEKAKTARESDIQTSPPVSVTEAEKGSLMYDDELQVTYTKTKVVKVEPLVLKKNKVICLFPEDKMTDQLKILRTRILNRLEEIGGNCLLVTSANPYEGKTFTSINLAISIAQELSRSVLLVDADLRPQTPNHQDFGSDFLGFHSNSGLSDYLLQKAEIPDLLLNPKIKKLTILPGGDSLPNSAELLGSSRMKTLVTEMKKRYSNDRIIILDSPALLTCPDPLVLSRYADGILLVVESEKTPAKDLKRTMELLNGKPVLGTLMNKAVF